MNVLDLDRRAVLRSIELVDSVEPGQVALPTPCDGWDLRALLMHMTSQHHAFAAAARLDVDDPAVWADRPLGTDYRGDYAAAAHDALAAFATDGVLGEVLRMPWISYERTFPGRQAISFHFLDYVVHGWDVAATLGVDRDIEDELLLATLRVAKLEVPDRPERLLPGSSFRPALPVGDGDGPQAELLQRLGRDPDWKA